jgi:hypothetical protein
MSSLMYGAKKRSKIEERLNTLFDAIKHGSPEHQAWLKQAIEDHLAGREVRKETNER